MKEYVISIHYETVVSARSEEEAVNKFWNDTVYDVQSGADSFLDDNIKIKEV